MNGKDFAIGILSVTAVVLLTAVILVQTLAPTPAMAAAGPGAVVGQYIVTAGQLDDTADLVYVMDTTAQRLNVYALDAVSGQIVVIQQIDVRPQPARQRR